MKKVKINSIEELKKYFTKYKDGFLFRGQTAHYINNNGDVNVPTSFSRHGCIPPIMFKWTHYSKAIIRAFTQLNYHEISSELSQAILQHYGWRSFYVDLTKSPQVACWFAVNQYNENNLLNMCENFEEEPIWLIHKEAKYVETNTKGHIYIVDTNILKKLNVTIYDLTELESTAGLLRFHAQQACLVGNFKDTLPFQAIIAHLEVENEILKEFYCESGIKHTSDIFPSRYEDFVLNSLLNIPWEKLPIDGPITTYQRGLGLPEYDIEFIKHLSTETALFNAYWIADNISEKHVPLIGIPFYKLPEIAYYATSENSCKLQEINQLLKTYDKFAIELDQLIKIVELNNQNEYEKGIVIEKITSDLVSISGLTIHHPGHQVSGIGTTRSWYYKIEDEQWYHIGHPEQCPCNNNLRHELHYSLLYMFNTFIKEKKIIQVGKLIFSHADIL
ncbi:MAG: FRG domain-containing protein [Campylobacterales bacterium]|nr:FRG domain-containing protein [Campylobacterales bacterium]